MWLESIAFIVSTYLGPSRLISLRRECTEIYEYEIKRENHLVNPYSQRAFYVNLSNMVGKIISFFIHSSLILAFAFTISDLWRYIIKYLHIMIQ